MLIMRDDILVRLFVSQINHACSVPNSPCQEDFARSLSEFRKLRVLDLCASVHLTSPDPPAGCPPILFEGELNLFVSEVVTSDEVSLRQKRATTTLAHSCPRLRRVYWSGLGNGWHPPSEVTIWRIHGEEDSDGTSPGDVSREGEATRATAYGDVFHRMQILVHNERSP